MDVLLVDFCQKFESYLNTDQELKRRLEGFATFSGIPDGHYTRTRQEGKKALVRAMRCYPFGGTSLLEDCEVIGIEIKREDCIEHCVVSLEKGMFTVKNSEWADPHLKLKLPVALFKKVLLGRYRWVWLMGMDEVEVEYSQGLPHSDWITILEILVAMQELLEFTPELLEQTDQL